MDLQLEIQEHTPFEPAADEPSTLLRYLPHVLAEPNVPGAEPFFDGFLKIIESIWSPLRRQLGQLDCYFDPRVTPAEFLPWLAAWVDLALDENWPEARRRKMVQCAAELYRRRGTRSAMRDSLEIYTGIVPDILESQDPEQPFHFSVILRGPEVVSLDPDRIHRIIREVKPAQTTYTLQLEAG